MNRYEASGERPDGGRLLRFKDLIRANVPVARQALREILIGPVVLESCRGWLHDPAGPALGALFPSARYWRPQGDLRGSRAG